MNNVQEMIHMIMWDRRYINIPANIESPSNIKTILLRYPALSEKNYALHVKKSQLDNAIENGVLTDEQLLKQAKTLGYWTERDENIYFRSEEKISFLESEISKQKFLIKRRSLEKELEQFKQECTLIFKKRNDITLLSADYYAHESSIYALLRKLVLKQDESLLWDTEESFSVDKSQYPAFVFHLAQAMLNELIFDISDIRQVAKSIEWRLVWVLNRENLASLFNMPVSDLNLSQRMLIYWSRIYDSAYESTEKPEQSVIDDDDLFDEWLLNRSSNDSKKTPGSQKIKDHKEQMNIIDGYYIETCTCGVGDKKVKGLGERPRHASNCPYGTWKPYTQAEKDKIADQIYSKNNPKIRQILVEEQKNIEKHGLIKEQHLRGRKSRLIMGMNSK